MSAEKGPPNTGTCCVVGVEGAAEALYKPSSSPTIISFFLLRPHCVPLFSSSSDSSSEVSPATTGAKQHKKKWRTNVLI
jgi:hypothetical protein